MARLNRAVLHRHESEEAANRRLFGAETTVAVDAIRGALLPDEPYIFLDDDGCGYARFWLRYDLAPHPVILVSPGKRSLRLKRVATASPRVLVVCNEDGSPPDFFDRKVFLAEEGVPVVR
jgi:hypothetical protein